MKFFIESRSGYCSLIWMFHGRRVNNKINHLREHSLRNLFTVHHRNINSLALELFKVKENLPNTMMNDILQTGALPYNLRSETDFASFINTSRFGLNSLRYFASKVWNIVPSDIKNASNLYFLEIK